MHIINGNCNGCYMANMPLLVRYLSSCYNDGYVERMLPIGLDARKPGDTIMLEVLL